MTSQNTKHDVLILGAGYAGLAAATNLAARVRRLDDVRITVVNPEDRFVERLRLHQTATGQEFEKLMIPELLSDSGADFVRGWVSAIDADSQTVLLDGERVLSYDTLVYAMGSVADTATIPGVDEYSYTLDSFAGAAGLADRLSGLAESPVVVAGSGLTGVEAAAEIAERYPDLDVTLLGRHGPASNMNPSARAYVVDTLGRLGVHVRTGVDVVKVHTDSVELAGGETVDAAAVLWTSGVRIMPIATDAGLAVDGHGRIVTDTALRSVSHPNVYAVGDAAAVQQAFGTLHGTCQSGMPTGVHVAMAIARERKGKEPKPFRFGYYHAPISLGRHDAVVQFTKPDDSPRRIFLKGRGAVRYKETVSASPWGTYGWMKKHPRSASLWPRGGRYTSRGGDMQ